MHERIAIVGAGRLGHSLMNTFPDAVARIFSRRTNPMRNRPTEDHLVVNDLESLWFPGCTLVWLAVPDDVIAEVAERLAGVVPDWDGVIVAHSSGAGSLGLLSEASALGAEPACLHPNSVLSGSRIPAETIWGVTANANARERVSTLLSSAGCSYVYIDDDVRPLYHLAATLTANYSRLLVEMSVRLYEAVGVGPEEGRAIATSLLKDAASEASHSHGLEGLTGPVARGDAETIRRHLEAVDRFDPTLSDLLRALVRATCLVLDTDEAHEVLDALGLSEPNAH